MSLYGSINLNAIELGSWQIRRLTPEVRKVNGYEWTWEGADGKRLTGLISHRYSDGAPALVSNVMAEIAKHVKAPIRT